jgi:nucleotide-binding universal stress UspA family protein
MNILICSDGRPAADCATRLGGLLARPLQATTTLLGIAERPKDERSLREALETQAQSLRANDVAPQIIVREGEPVRQILEETSARKYDLVVIGSRRKGSTGLYWRSEKTYELIKSIAPPVLVAIGECQRLQRFLVCTGGKEFIDPAVQLTGTLAAAIGASVTLLHVLAEPPALYADLVRLEEDVERLLHSKSELGLNLRRQKEKLEQMRVRAEVRVRHGIVIDQVFAEAEEGKYDLIVSGSSQARGMLRHYIMGDLTRSILNHAACPVLVARAGEMESGGRFWSRCKRIFGGAGKRVASK